MLSIGLVALRRDQEASSEQRQRVRWPCACARARRKPHLTRKSKSKDYRGADSLNCKLRDTVYAPESGKFGVFAAHLERPCRGLLDIAR